jgi:hypothetical protein
LQGVRSRWKGLRDRNARKSAKPHGSLLAAGAVGDGRQVKVTLRQINRAAVFSDEGLSVAVFAAGIIELEPGTAGQPHGGNACVIKRRCEFVKAMEAVSTKRNQRVDGEIKDIGCLAQSVSEAACTILTEYWNAHGSGKQK